MLMGWFRWVPCAKNRAVGDSVLKVLGAGCCGAGVGGNLVNKNWIADGEFDKITRLAASLVEKLNAARHY